MTFFLATVQSSIKEVKAPFMFDGYHGIALHATQGNQASYHGKGKVSWFFSNLSGTWVTFSRNGPEGPSKFMFVQLRQDYCLVVRDTSGFSLGKELQ